MRIKLYRNITQQLFDHMLEEHGLILLESQLDDIFNICRNNVSPKIHIIKTRKKWAVKIQGRKIARRILNSKEDAIEYCYSTLRFRQVIIHNQYGEVENIIYT